MFLVFNNVISICTRYQPSSRYTSINYSFHCHICKFGLWFHLKTPHQQLLKTMLTAVVWRKCMPAALLFFLLFYRHFFCLSLEPLRGRTDTPSSFFSVEQQEGCATKELQCMHAATYENHACIWGAHELIETVPGKTYRKLPRNTQNAMTTTPPL